MPKMPSGSAPSMPAKASSAPTGTGNVPSVMPGMSFGADPDPKAKTVWIKDDKMGIRPCKIIIGIDNGSKVEVLTGLKEGDEVVISTGDGTASAGKKNNNGPPGFPF
jgi:hypothetical protein